MESGRFSPRNFGITLFLITAIVQTLTFNFQGYFISAEAAHRFTQFFISNPAVTSLVCQTIFAIIVLYLTPFLRRKLLSFIATCEPRQPSASRQPHLANDPQIAYVTDTRRNISLIVLLKLIYAILGFSETYHSILSVLLFFSLRMCNLDYFSIAAAIVFYAWYITRHEQLIEILSHRRPFLIDVCRDWRRLNSSSITLLNYVIPDVQSLKITHCPITGNALPYSASNSHLNEDPLHFFYPYPVMLYSGLCKSVMRTLLFVCRVSSLFSRNADGFLTVCQLEGLFTLWLQQSVTTIPASFNESPFLRAMRNWISTIDYRVDKATLLSELEAHKALQEQERLDIERKAREEEIQRCLAKNNDFVIETMRQLMAAELAKKESENLETRKAIGTLASVMNSLNVSVSQIHSRIDVIEEKNLSSQNELSSKIQSYVEKVNSISPAVDKLSEQLQLISSKTDSSPVDVNSYLDSLSALNSKMEAISAANRSSTDDIKHMLTSELSSVNSQLHLLSSDVESLVNKLDGLDAKVNATNEMNALLNSNYEGLNAKTEAISSSVEKFNAAISSITEEVSSMTSKIDSLETNITSTTSTLNSIQSDVASSILQADTVDATLKKLAVNVSSVESKIETLGFDVSSKFDNLQYRISSKVDIMQSRVLQQVDIAQSEISDVQSKVNAIDSTLNTKVDIINNEISTITDSVTSVRAKIDFMSISIDSNTSHIQSIHSNVSTIKDIVQSPRNTNVSPSPSVITAIDGVNNKVNSLVENFELMHNCFELVNAKIDANFDLINSRMNDVFTEITEMTADHASLNKKLILSQSNSTNASPKNQSLTNSPRNLSLCSNESQSIINKIDSLATQFISFSKKQSELFDKVNSTTITPVSDTATDSSTSSQLTSNELTFSAFDHQMKLFTTVFVSEIAKIISNVNNLSGLVKNLTGREEQLKFNHTDVVSQLRSQLLTSSEESATSSSCKSEASVDLQQTGAVVGEEADVLEFTKVNSFIYSKKNQKSINKNRPQSQKQRKQTRQSPSKKSINYESVDEESHVIRLNGQPDTSKQSSPLRSNRSLSPLANDDFLLNNIHSNNKSSSPHSFASDGSSEKSFEGNANYPSFNHYSKQSYNNFCGKATGQMAFASDESISMDSCNSDDQYSHKNKVEDAIDMSHNNKSKRTNKSRSQSSSSSNLSDPFGWCPPRQNACYNRPDPPKSQGFPDFGKFTGKTNSFKNSFKSKKQPRTPSKPSSPSNLRDASPLLPSYQDACYSRPASPERQEFPLLEKPVDLSPTSTKKSMKSEVMEMTPLKPYLFSPLRKSSDDSSFHFNDNKALEISFAVPIIGPDNPWFNFVFGYIPSPNMADMYQPEAPELRVAAFYRENYSKPLKHIVDSLDPNIIKEKSEIITFIQSRIEREQAFEAYHLQKHFIVKNTFPPTSCTIYDTVESPYKLKHIPRAWRFQLSYFYCERFPIFPRISNESRGLETNPFSYILSILDGDSEEDLLALKPLAQHTLRFTFPYASYSNGFNHESGTRPYSAPFLSYFNGPLHKKPWRDVTFMYKTVPRHKPRRFVFLQDQKLRNAACKLSVHSWMIAQRRFDRSYRSHGFTKVHLKEPLFCQEGCFDTGLEFAMEFFDKKKKFKCPISRISIIQYREKISRSLTEYQYTKRPLCQIEFESDKHKLFSLMENYSMNDVDRHPLCRKLNDYCKPYLKEKIERYHRDFEEKLNTFIFHITCLQAAYEKGMKEIKRIEKHNLKYLENNPVPLIHDYLKYPDMPTPFFEFIPGFLEPAIVRWEPDPEVRSRLRELLRLVPRLYTDSWTLKKQMKVVIQDVQRDREAQAVLDKIAKREEREWNIAYRNHVLYWNKNREKIPFDEEIEELLEGGSSRDLTRRRQKHFLLTLEMHEYDLNRGDHFSSIVKYLGMVVEVYSPQSRQFVRFIRAYGHCKEPCERYGLKDDDGEPTNVIEISHIKAVYQVQNGQFLFQYGYGKTFTAYEYARNYFPYCSDLNSAREAKEEEEFLKRQEKYEKMSPERQQYEAYLRELKREKEYEDFIEYLKERRDFKRSRILEVKMFPEVIGLRADRENRHYKREDITVHFY